ncbi:MAG: hypothetical protein F9K32_17810 [Desulfobulbaceae bacterium]|nr:MAG: hypothetical protein F9K32_17810 [Desulfobulbaceae bacterium]
MMKARSAIVLFLVLVMGSYSYAADKNLKLTTVPGQGTLGQQIQFVLNAYGMWQPPLVSATIQISNGSSIVAKGNMRIEGMNAYYDYVIPADQKVGNWNYICVVKDSASRFNTVRKKAYFTVQAAATGPDPGGDLVEAPISAHNVITKYDGPMTCVACHQEEADDMLDSLHMKWSGPTPDLTNTNGEEIGKGDKGINTFCTYAVSSKGACYSCHVRADGNAPHPPEAKDVDCMMCHNDVYMRKFTPDPNSALTVTNILGQLKTYVFGKVDAEGNYLSEPDFAKMPAGTTMVNLARTVHLPTNKSCLRCHATAGGGDWTKRGDMGLNSAQATVDQDFHLAKDGANLTCASCHSAPNHKIGGRGIDLRATEAAAPKCQDCHSAAPHSNATLNSHAQGQVSCQVCHIREYAKGGATEMSRDWRTPVWNQAFCSGQGGFVGEEVKETMVKPEYVWFDGTSSVYNVGETIEPDVRGIYPMAKANGAPFDGKSRIVPIKRHFSVMPLHESGKIIPPVIMWMFMTGNFDLAVQKGMEDQGMTGSYQLVETDAEMMITHGVDPKSKAPSCAECHNSTGSTPDGTGMIPFEALGYHEMPAKVSSCTLCHSSKSSSSWQSMHSTHKSKNVSCSSCHSPAPTGLVKPTSTLCSSCHGQKSWSSSSGHSKHIKQKIACATCHTFT